MNDPKKSSVIVEFDEISENPVEKVLPEHAEILARFVLFVVFHCISNALTNDCCFFLSELTLTEQFYIDVANVYAHQEEKSKAQSQVLPFFEADLYLFHISFVDGDKRRGKSFTQCLAFC
jgi:hypothetical protein